MSVPCKFERSLLSHEEYEAVRVTHHPTIYDLDEAQLREIKLRLREMRDKEQTLGRQKRREMRGKADARGGSFPGTVERPLQRKQVFVSALKRVNKEMHRLRNLAALGAHMEAARRALQLRRAAQFTHHPETGDTASHGMRPLPSRPGHRFLGQKLAASHRRGKFAQARREARQ